MSRKSISTIDLPVVNLSRKCMLNPATRNFEAQKLIGSFNEVGFCLVTGVEGYDVEELFKWTKWFYHDVSEEDKFDQLATKPFNPQNSNIYRGYFPLIPGQLSHKQGYDLGPIFMEGNIPKGEEGNPFTETTPRLNLKGRETEVETFYNVMYKHYEIVKKKADLIMSLIAECGGETSNYFEDMFCTKTPMHTFRPIRYPKRVDNIPKNAFLKDGRIISTPAHMDSGFLTLLQVFNYQGLEINIEDEWYAVTPKENTLVVNLGEQMTQMSNGRFKSTIHRVIDIGQERFSLPFFYEPSYNTNINTKIPEQLLPKGSEVEYPKSEEKFPYASFLLNKLPIYAEYSDICKNIPDWMKDKYLNHSKTIDCWATKAGIETDGQNYHSGNA